jgi:hypothetical protein
MKKTLASFVSTALFFYSASWAFAAGCSSGEFQTDLGCIPNKPLDFAARIYSIGLGLIGAVALLLIIYGGYLILSSRGDQLQLQKGKSYVVSAIIGIVMAVAGYSIYQIIAVDVVKIPGFTR